MNSKYKVIGVIPARYESSRLAHKLLLDLCGKPLIQWTWESAKSARLLDKLIIACDDQKIEEAGKEFGAEVVMTSTGHASGTDRIAETVVNIDTDIVINIQADEPLIHFSIIDSLAQTMIDDPELMMATVKTKITDPQDIKDPGIVKVICDKDDFAIYFSRSPVPYLRDKGSTYPYNKHLGIYAYRKDFLYTFKNLPPSKLEEAEKLEQLRALEAGFKIKVIETAFGSWGVDTEEDFEKIKKIIEERKNRNAQIQE